MLLSVALVVAAAPAAEVYRVAGVVVNASTNAPLPHARILLLRTETPDVVASMITGDDGRFSLDVPRGKFRLNAGSRVAMNSLGARTPDSLAGTAVVTGPGQDTANLVVRWFPPAGISGRVVDQYGEPVESAIVQLLTSRVIGGRRTVATWIYVRTDDQGNYRLGPLHGGTYYVAVSGEPWHEKRTRDGADSGPSMAYAPMYSGNTNDVARAAPVVLRAGEEARADFTVSVVPGATVTIKHDAPEGARGTVSLLTDGVGGAEGFQRTDSYYGYGQEVRFAGVPPGRYVVRMQVAAGAATLVAYQEAMVSGAGASIELHLRPYAAVSGRVELQNPRGPRRGSLYVRLTSNRGALQAIVRPDGAFAFPAIGNGKYRPTVNSLDGHFASQIRVEGAEYRDGEIDVREGQTIALNMVARDDTGTVEGFVMDGERAVEGVMVALVPATESNDPGQYRGFQTDSDGSFELRNVPAGEYLLFAIADSEFEYANRDALRPYRSSAKAIRVEARTTSTHRIDVSAPVK